MNNPIMEAILKYNEQVKDYCYGRDEEQRLVKSWQEFEKGMTQLLIDKGYGWTTIHTADIELMLKVIEEQEKELRK